MSDRSDFFLKLLSEGFEKIKSAKKLSEAFDPVTAAVTDPGPAAPPAPPAQAPANVSPGMPTQGQPAAPGAEAQPQITIDTVIQKLNTIRRGKSFNDAPLYDQLSNFFNTLSEPDKVSLDRLLSQIGQIVISNLPQPTAPIAQTPQMPPPAAPPAAPPAPQIPPPVGQ
jgi:hypothetical protein